MGEWKLIWEEGDGVPRFTTAEGYGARKLIFSGEAKVVQAFEVDRTRYKIVRVTPLEVRGVSVFEEYEVVESPDGLRIYGLSDGLARWAPWTMQVAALWTTGKTAQLRVLEGEVVEVSPFEGCRARLRVSRRMRERVSALIHLPPPSKRAPPFLRAVNAGTLPALKGRLKKSKAAEASLYFLSALRLGYREVNIEKVRIGTIVALVK